MRAADSLSADPRLVKAISLLTQIVNDQEQDSTERPPIGASEELVLRVLASGKGLTVKDVLAHLLLRRMEALAEAEGRS